MIEDDPLMREDLDEDVLIFIVATVGAVHDETPKATGPEIEVVKCIGEAVRPPPTLQMLRLAPSLPDERTRRSEDTGRDDFAFAHVFLFICRHSSLLRFDLFGFDRLVSC